MILIIVALWLVLMRYRKNYEMKLQLIAASIGTILGFGIESIAINFDIWNYSSGNWPLILWVMYFVSALLMYQIVRTVDEKMSQKAKK